MTCKISGGSKNVRTYGTTNLVVHLKGKHPELFIEHIGDFFFTIPSLVRISSVEHIQHKMCNDSHARAKLIEIIINCGFAIIG